MTALRSRLIRLAHQNPELRPQLLPLLREAGAYGPEDSGEVGDIVEHRQLPPDLLASLVAGISNGLGFAAADYTVEVPEAQRAAVSRVLYEVALREFVREGGYDLSEPLAKTAEYGSYSNINWPEARKALARMKTAWENLADAVREESEFGVERDMGIISTSLLDFRRAILS